MINNLKFRQFFRAYGDSVTLSLPKWLRDHMSIDTTQAVTGTISERRGYYIIVFRLPVVPEIGKEHL